MAQRAVDIVDVTPIDDTTPPDPAVLSETEPPETEQSDPAVPPVTSARGWGLAASVGRIVAWLVAAALALVAAWRPVTSELHIIPPVYGIPFGYIRQSTNGWGQVATTHSSFEGVDPSAPGQPVAVVFCLCAAAMVCAALLDAARTFRALALTNPRRANTPRARWMPTPAWVGGSGGLVLAGTVAGIRAERLPDRPLDLPYGIVSQYGSGLWLAGAAVVAAALAGWADLRIRRDPVDRRPRRPLGVHPAVFAGGIGAAALTGAAATARAYSVSTSGGGSVVYRFAASGTVTRVHQPLAYSELGAALGEVRAVDYVLPLAVAGVMLLLGLVPVAIAGRRGRPISGAGLAMPGLFLTGLLAAQIVDDHAVAAQLRLANPSLLFTVGWSPLLTGAAAAVSLTTWALAAHPERVSSWRPRRSPVDRPVDPTPTGVDLLL